MERSFRGHLKGKGGWNQFPKECKTDPDTMIEPAMSGVVKIAANHDKTM